MEPEAAVRGGCSYPSSTAMTSTTGTQANVVTTPGAGFGPSGEGYIRMTAFGDADQTVEAVARVAALLKK